MFLETTWVNCYMVRARWWLNLQETNGNLLTVCRGISTVAFWIKVCEIMRRNVKYMFWIRSRVHIVPFAEHEHLFFNWFQWEQSECCRKQPPREKTQRSASSLWALCFFVWLLQALEVKIFQLFISFQKSCSDFNVEIGGKACLWPCPSDKNYHNKGLEPVCWIKSAEWTPVLLWVTWREGYSFPNTLFNTLFRARVSHFSTQHSS